MFKRGSKDKEKFSNWVESVNHAIKTGKNLIEDLQDLNDKEIDDLEKLNGYQELKEDFISLKVNELVEEIFSLKGKEKDQENELKQELNIFLEDKMFFIKEIDLKIDSTTKLQDLLKLIEEITNNLAKNEPNQQKLARTIPRLNNTGEVDLAEKELAKLRNFLPNEIEKSEEFSEDINIKIERTNLVLKEWNKKLDFIESSILRYKNKIENSTKQVEHKEKLDSVHSWLDSSEVKLKKIKDSIKEILDLINDDNTPSKDLLNFGKKYGKIKEELSSIKLPDMHIDGENQTVLGIENRIKEISSVNEEIKEYQEQIWLKLNYRLAYVRTRILERMFLKSHQLSFSKVNYSLGLRNELLLKGWLDEIFNQESTDVLKNHLNKYVMLTNVSMSNYKEASKEIFNSIQKFTDYERTNNDISYRASLKWLIQNDSKWLED